MMAQTNDWKGSHTTYDESTDSYRVGRDSSELLNTNVALSIAAIESARPTQLPPLAQTIGPDALETVFGCSEGAILSFSHTGYRMTLDALGSIEVVPIDDSQPLQ